MFELLHFTLSLFIYSQSHLLLEKGSAHPAGSWPEEKIHTLSLAGKLMRGLRTQRLRILLAC